MSVKALSENSLKFNKQVTVEVSNICKESNHYIQLFVEFFQISHIMHMKRTQVSTRLLKDIWKLLIRFLSDVLVLVCQTLGGSPAYFRVFHWHGAVSYLPKQLPISGFWSTRNVRNKKFIASKLQKKKQSMLHLGSNPWPQDSETCANPLSHADSLETWGVLSLNVVSGAVYAS